MSQGKTPPPVPVPRRSRFRRPLWIILGVIAVTVIAWLGHGAWQDWADARAWQEYLAEWDRREPNWRERVYGRPATEAEEESRQRLVQLDAAVMKNGWNAWNSYRQSLYGGFVQDPDQPAALLAPEQHEFLRWSRGVMKPFVEQAHQIDTLVPLSRYLNQDLPYDKMIAAANADLGRLYVIDEVTELQALFWMQENNSEEAIRWLRRSLKLQDMQGRLTAFGRLGTVPYLVERLLNLTEPSTTALAALQKDLEALLASRNRFVELSTHLRLGEHRLRAYRRSDMTDRDLNVYAAFFFTHDSEWNSWWAKPIRAYYLRFLFSSMFRRHAYVLLRLHQVADRIEEMADLPATQAWQKWHAFAQENRLSTEVQLPLPATGTDAVPLGVHFFMPGLHTAVILLFNQEAQLTSALAAVAAERFRRDQGRFPENWTDLVPRYLAAEPMDPYTGRPLVLKKTPQGIVIYSLGHEGRDDGGEQFCHLVFWHYGTGSRLSKNTNVGIRLYAPAHRRAPPLELEDEAKEALKTWKKYQTEQAAQQKK